MAPTKYPLPKIQYIKVSADKAVFVSGKNAYLCGNNKYSNGEYITTKHDDVNKQPVQIEVNGQIKDIAVDADLLFVLTDKLNVKGYTQTPELFGLTEKFTKQWVQIAVEAEFTQIVTAEAQVYLVNNPEYKAITNGVEEMPNKLRVSGQNQNFILGIPD